MMFWLQLFNQENRNDLETWAATAVLSEQVTAEKTYQAMKVHFLIIQLFKVWKQTSMIDCAINNNELHLTDNKRYCRKHQIFVVAEERPLWEYLHKAAGAVMFFYYFFFRQGQV